MSASLWQWIEATGIAMRIHDSLMLTASLSAIHVIGMTLLSGSVLVSNLRFFGVIFPELPVIDVTRATRTGILVGLGISVASGALLFSPRAAAAASSRIFVVKMCLLVAAGCFHFLVYRRLGIRPDIAPSVLRMTGMLSVVLWLGVAAAGAAFILLD